MAPKKKDMKIKNNIEALKSLKSLGPLKLDALLPHLSHNINTSIAECAFNCMYNSDKLMSSRQKTKLKKKLGRNKVALEKLVHGKLPQKVLKQRLEQVGGASLNTILAETLPALVSMLGIML